MRRVKHAAATRICRPQSMNRTHETSRLSFVVFTTKIASIVTFEVRDMRALVSLYLGAVGNHRVGLRRR